MIARECEPAYYRPTTRKLKDLTNEELQQLFELRASKVKLDPEGMWDDVRIVYWGTMRRYLAALYEVLMEIQARYPKSEITKYADYDDGSYPIEDALLPVNFRLQPQGQELEHAERRAGRAAKECNGTTEADSAENHAPKPGKLPCGLKEM